MTLVGCDLHSRKQQVAVLDTTTGEVLEQELAHDGDAVERFYRALTPPVTIGIEATGYSQWFHALMHSPGPHRAGGGGGEDQGDGGTQDKDRSARHPALARSAQARSIPERVDARSRHARPARAYCPPRPLGPHAHDGQEWPPGDCPEPSPGSALESCGASVGSPNCMPSPARSHDAPARGQLGAARVAD